MAQMTNYYGFKGNPAKVQGLDLERVLHLQELRLAELQYDHPKVMHLIPKPVEAKVRAEPKPTPEPADIPVPWYVEAGAELVSIEKGFCVKGNISRKGMSAKYKVRV